MSNPVLRSIVAVLAGVVAGGIVVGVVEVAGHAVFPPPPGVDVTDPAGLEAIMNSIPIGAKLMVVLAWFLGALAGGWVAALAARRLDTHTELRSALATGALLLAFGAYTLVTIPHPAWMAALGLVLPMPAAWLGARLAGAA